MNGFLNRPFKTHTHNFNVAHFGTLSKDLLFLFHMVPTNPMITESEVSMTMAGLFEKATSAPVFWTSSQYGCYLAVMTVQAALLL